MKSAKMLFVRLLSLIVVLVTCLAILPSAAFAEGIWNTDQSIGDNLDEAINAQVVIEGSNAVAVWVQHVPYDDGYTVYDEYLQGLQQLLHRWRRYLARTTVDREQCRMLGN